jgi:hypothetical protein
LRHEIVPYGLRSTAPSTVAEMRTTGAHIGTHYGTDLIDYVHQEFGGPGMDRMDARWDPQGVRALLARLLLLTSRGSTLASPTRVLVG